MKQSKLPKSLAQCADLLYTTRQQRIAFSKKLDEMKALEGALREHLINTLPKGEASGIAGRVARASIKVRTVPVAQDWSKVWKYVSKKKAFDLVQRRLNEDAVKQRWEAGEGIPGIGKFNDKYVSLEKVS